MRIAVISDIHANIPALDAVLADLDGSFDGLWATGDIVGYGAEPDAVVARLRAADAVAVRGNHDHVAVGNPGADWFNPTARAAIQWTATTIRPDTRDWLAGLPEERDVSGWRLVHGSPRQPLWEYIVDAGVAAEVMREVPIEVGVFGHTHLPAAFVEEGGRVRSLPVGDDLNVELGERRALLNPGSVGQPRDGDPRASYLVIDTVEKRATWHRVPYDIETAAARIRDAGLPDWLASRLSSGH
jgi:diadenosine tetraphosphatase ApaH/serine/threonine PP2A family protein phosphatase